jgi:hypothetical protein
MHGMWCRWHLWQGHFSLIESHAKPRELRLPFVRRTDKFERVVPFCSLLRARPRLCRNNDPLAQRPINARLPSAFDSRESNAGNSLPRDEGNFFAEPRLGLTKRYECKCSFAFFFLFSCFVSTRAAHRETSHFNLRSRELRQVTSTWRSSFGRIPSALSWDAASFRLFASVSIMSRNHLHCKISTARASDEQTEPAMKGRARQRDEWPFVSSRTLSLSLLTLLTLPTGIFPKHTTFGTLDPSLLELCCLDYQRSLSSRIYKNQAETKQSQTGKVEELIVLAKNANARSRPARDRYADGKKERAIYRRGRMNGIKYARVIANALLRLDELWDSRELVRVRRHLRETDILCKDFAAYLYARMRERCLRSFAVCAPSFQLLFTINYAHKTERDASRDLR